MNNPELSVVVPLYNEELVIEAMYEKLSAVLSNAEINYEVVMVNDGSRDQTISLAQKICESDPRVKLLSFSRNFGHQIAITAGMDRCAGQAIVVIDADLQDPPAVIIDMMKIWKQGYQVVYGVREKRKGESWFKIFTAASFYRILKRMTSVEIPVDTGDFRLLDRSVLDEFKKMRERARFVRGMVSWIGFKQGAVYYSRDPRLAGETKYPLSKMVRFAVDGILSFSQIPLRISSAFGLISAAISFFFMLYGIIVKYFFPQNAIPGWASLFSAILFIGGVQLICMGVLGEYVGRIYEETKGRPLYIVEKEINFNNKTP